MNMCAHKDFLAWRMGGKWVRNMGTSMNWPNVILEWLVASWMQMP